MMRSASDRSPADGGWIEQVMGWLKSVLVLLDLQAQSTGHLERSHSRG